MYKSALISSFLIVALSGCVSDSATRKDMDVNKASQLYADLGLAYLQQGDTERAQAKLKKALELNKRNAQAHHYIAEVYKNLDDPEFAEKHYKASLKLDTQDAMVLNNYGAFLCGESRFSDAETYFLQAATVHRYKTPELAYENVALCAMRSAMPDKAMEYFRRALSIKPDMPKSLFNMAQVSYNIGEALKARAFIQRLHTVTPKTESSLALAIQVEAAIGDQVAVAKYKSELAAMTSPVDSQDVGAAE